MAPKVLKDIAVLPIRSKAEDYTDAEKTGRLKIIEVELEEGKLQITDLYGWAGAIKGSTAAKRVDNLLATAANELEMQEFGPKMIVGDMNGDLDFPTIQDMINNHGWTDIGSCEHLCTGGAIAPTCNIRTKP